MVELLEKIREVFPELMRITSYARIKTLKAKKEENLIKLHKAGLSRLHIGLESGSEKVLTIIRKGSKPKHFIETAPIIRNANIEFCFYVLLGIGGREYTKEHAIETAKVINEAKPDFVRFRTIIPLPRSGIKKKFDSGELTYLSDKEIIEEQYNIIKNLNVNTYIANDHISNLVALEGKLLDNKKYFLNVLEEAMEIYSDKKRNYEELINYL